MFTKFGKILTLAAVAMFMSVGVAVADPSSSDWNNSWGFLSPNEKANLLNQALAIELVENDGFNNYNTNSFSTAIGNIQNINVDGDGNNVSGNGQDNDGNVSAQNNDGSGEIEQEVETEYNN